MSKAKLTMEQIEALESALEVSNKEEVIRWHIQDLWSGKREPLNKLPLEKLIVALYIGYEMELSKEKKLLNYIEELQQRMAATGCLRASERLSSVYTVLEILDIDLEEVSKQCLNIR